MKALNVRHSVRAAIVVATCLFAGVDAMAHDNSRFAQCNRTNLAEFDGSIVDAAVATPALSTLTNLVVAANLAGPLSADGRLTVYAPTNDAFAKIPPAILAAIGSDNAALRSVLTYHVVSGRADPRRSIRPREVRTLQGQSVFLSFNQVPRINQSTTTCQGIRTRNGTVWLVDSVLMPQFK